MALRENQFYQIGLIISVMLMVVLAVLAFWGFSSANQATDRANTLDTQLKDAENVKRAAQSAVDAMQIMLGTEPGDLDTMLNQVTDDEISKELQSVKEEFDKDMQLYTSTTDDLNSRSYRSLVENLMTSLSTKINDLQTAQENVRQANTEKDTKVTEAEDRAATLASEVSALNEKLDAALADNEAIKAEFENQLAAAKNSHAQGVEQFTNEIAQQKNQLQTLEQQVSDVTQALTVAKDDLRRYQRTKFPVPDGRIVNLSASQDRVYINLGFDDGLQRRVSFSVFGRGVQLEAGLEKAAVEVTRILGPHQAEARVIQSSERDPILPNDSVVTATWDPGYEVPVAIAGTIDFDGDGVSDLERLKALIRKNQGVIAAVADDEGNVQGEITASVRYLILGSEPEGEQQQQAWSQLSRQADRYYVQSIGVREFLHLNGYTPDVPIQDVNLSTQTTDGFVPRRPPGGSSAFDR